MRLEFLLRQTYPNLIEQHQEAEEYMNDQQISNVNYTGPIRVSFKPVKQLFKN